MMQKEKWLCILGASTAQLPFIQAATDSGINTLVVDQDSAAPAASLATRFLQSSAYDYETVIAFIENQKCELRLDGCFTHMSNTAALISAAHICNHFNLPGTRPEAIRLVDDKEETQRELRRIGFTTAPNITTKRFVELSPFVSDFERVICKPAKLGLGSCGVSSALSNDKIALSRAFNKAQKASPDDEVIVEAFVNGTEYSVDGFINGESCELLCLSRKYHLKKNNSFVIEGFQTCSEAHLQRELPSTKKFNLTHFCLKILNAIGVRYSFFSLDIIVNEIGIFIIDVGLLVDCKIDRLLHHLGHQVYRNRCALALSNSGGYHMLEVYDMPKPGNTLVLLYANRDGRLSIRDNTFTQSMLAENQRVIEWQRSQGEAVSLPQSVADTLGWVIYANSNNESHSKASLSAWQASKEIAQPGILFNVE